GRGAGVGGNSTPGKFPFFGSIATKMLGPRQPGMPANVAISHAMSIGLRPGYFGGNYLGPQENPFETEGDPNNDKFQVKNLGLAQQLRLERLNGRRGLIGHVDHLRHEADKSGTLEAMDRFDRQAF